MTNTPQWAITKICEVKEKKLKELNLIWYQWRNEDKQLTKIPPEIFELEWLEKIDLSGNNIVELPNLLLHFPQLRSFGFRWEKNKPIPDWINRVSELKVDLSQFNISDILPYFIFYLTNLNTLNLNNNQLTSVPESITRLTNLNTLNLNNNQLTSIPESITRLTNLTTLHLSYNKLTSIPESITRITNLNKLHLNNNQISSVPGSINRITNLNTLDLSYNQLIVVPESITHLTNLTTLNLINNKLISVPKSITRLTNLTTLHLNNNQLTSVPESINRLTNLNTLNLSNNQISSVPESINRLTNLTTLNLNQNQLSSVPESITHLTNLTTLYLSHNQISSVPESINRLNNLTILDLRNNQLRAVPESINCLNNLTGLDLSYNQLTSVPESITRLTNLTTLYLSHNQLRAVPESITRLTNLTTLDLSENQLTSVPESINHLTNLTTLYLIQNQLTSVPESITHLTNLTTLYLIQNQLTSVPESITRLTNLNTLDLRNNPLEKPPLEIARKGIAAIREYFQQLAEEGLDYLYEAKLLIIGESGAGKTTLAKKIENQDYQLQEEDSTKGIEIIKWNFSIEDRKYFRVNIWDFGGQEIYHTTHQFFLTKRSLYILVADTRKEDTDFYYWLNIVELLAEYSPLIIVKNEKQDRHRDINENQLRGEFSNLQKTISTNLKTNRGYEDILISIKHYIQSLPHVGSALPKTWVKVREALEQDSRNYISLDEYIKTCSLYGFKQRKDKLQLSGYLHDLGVCLHFQDDALLNKTVILKPKWGTDAVYKLLDNHKVIRNLGKFTKSDLQNIWCEEEYALMHDELLRLMCRFRLAYEVPNNPGNYIAPQLLSENKPDYNWDENNNLILRYTYEFMPKGIITQFIVVMHQLIQEQKYVWKTGVILSKDYTKAEVIEYYGKREIKIRVTGKYKRDLMTNVVYELDKIHNSYKRLKCQKLIPCNCPVCKLSQSPYFYRYDELRERYIHRKYSIECGKPPYNTVQVLELIDDVITRENFLEQESKDKYDESEAQEKYKASLQIKDEQIEEYRQKYTDMKEITSLLVSKSINVQVESKSESKIMTNDSSRKIEIGSIGRDFNASGQALNLGDISGTVTNIINELPASPSADKPGIKELLTQLQTAIEESENLTPRNKQKALKQVKILAEASQNPSDEENQDLADTAITMLKGLISGLPSAATLIEACNNLLPQIYNFLGID